jgi:hypothetical protein
MLFWAFALKVPRKVNKLWKIKFCFNPSLSKRFKRFCFWFCNNKLGLVDLFPVYVFLGSCLRLSTSSTPSSGPLTSCLLYLASKLNQMSQCCGWRYKFMHGQKSVSANNDLAFVILAVHCDTQYFKHNLLWFLETHSNSEPYSYYP